MKRAQQCCLAIAIAALSHSDAHSAGIPGQGTWETTLHARDINTDGITDAYFDSSLGITWLANWNYLGRTRNYETLMSIHVPDLNVYGVKGWRLPSALNSDGSGPCSGYGCSGSEIGHMWHVTLGNGSGRPFNTADFVNMQYERYWTNTRDTNVFFAWQFSTVDGLQGTSSTGHPRWAEFVLDGDVSAVPEPKAWLMLICGISLAFASRHKRFRGEA